MTPRTLLAAGFGAAAFIAVLISQTATARDLSVTGRGDALQSAQDDAYFQPFTAITGLPVTVSSWSGGLATLRSRIEGGANDWDAVLLHGNELLQGCDDGLYEKLDWAALGGRDHYLPMAVSDCGVGTAVSSIVLAWDRDKFAAVPSWADFWDVARYPGKRGLRRSARSNLEIALMADGVAPGDVYRLLRTDDGVDRAFRKLDQLRPYITWWGPDKRGDQMLESGEVLLTSADSVAVTSANRSMARHFGIQWTGSLYSVQSWAVMKGSPNLTNALKLLAFAGDPVRQAKVSTAVPYGPTAKGANEALPPDMVAASPTAAANLTGALQIDEQFWRDNGAKLTQRFDAWLAQH
jgi:putative spermidine/putrescine transport system substrate-binding protein